MVVGWVWVKLEEEEEAMAAALEVEGEMEVAVQQVVLGVVVVQAGAHNRYNHVHIGTRLCSLQAHHHRTHHRPLFH